MTSFELDQIIARLERIGTKTLDDTLNQRRVVDDLVNVLIQLVKFYGRDVDARQRAQ